MANNLPDPITRKEQYLNNIALGEGEIPEYPIFREEQYLDYIAKHGGEEAVESVNGQTGVVVLDASDIDTDDSNVQTELDGLGNAVDALDSDVTTAENAIGVINTKIPTEASATNKLADKNFVTTSITSVENEIDTINSKIPEQATAANKLADKNFVNSSIATNTANYIYKTVGSEHLPFNSVDELEAYAGVVTNNDYAFVTGTDAVGNAYFDRYKAVVSGSSITWAKEYRLNNSSFTAEQWAAIQSGITSGLVARLLVTPIATPTEKVLIGVDTANSESQYTAGVGLDIRGSTSPYSLNVAGVELLTTAPTAANTDGIKIVYLTSEPATKYNGYLYLIKE